MRFRGMGSATEKRDRTRFRTIIAISAGIFILSATSFFLGGEEKLLAIKGGRIHTITEGIIADGVILIRGDKIADIGADVPIPAGTEVLDYSENFIMPGVVSPHSYLGIPPPSVEEQRAAARTGPVVQNLADYPVRFSIYPEDPDFLLALKNGMTTIGISPRPAGIAGLGAVIAPGGDRLKDLLIEERAFLKINVDANTLFWNMLKKALEEAKEKAKEKKKSVEDKKQEKDETGKKDTGKSAEGNEEEEEIGETTKVFMDVVEGKLPLVADCVTPGTLSHFLSLLSGFPKVKAIVVGGPEIYRTGSALKEKDIPVILSPEIQTIMRWSRADRTNYVLKCQNLDLQMAFQLPGDIQEQIHLFDYLNRLAYLGVKKDILFRGVTIIPAEILGLEKVVGSLEKGKRADLIVFRNDPLENIPVVERVLSGGKLVK